MLYVPGALAVLALSVISSATCQQPISTAAAAAAAAAPAPAAAPPPPPPPAAAASTAGHETPLLRNLRILHNKPLGANVTWEYTGPDPSSPHPVFFTVQYYKAALYPCCGPHTVVQCNHTERPWCQMDDLEGDMSYHIQVTSTQGPYSSKASSVGFFENGNNAPAGCPLQYTAKPSYNCWIQLEFLLGDTYTQLLAQHSVTVTITYSNAVSKHVQSVPLLTGGHDYQLRLWHSTCNATFDVTWEAVTNVSGVERTTGNCFNAQVNTTVSRAPVAPRLVDHGVGSTSVDLQWTLGVPVKGKNSSYMVCFRDITNSVLPRNAKGSLSVPTEVTHCSQIHGSSQTWATLQRLTPGSVYSVNVTASNRFGHGPASNSITVTTQDTDPVWSDALTRCALLNSTSVVITWPAPAWNTLPSHRLRTTVTVLNGTGAFVYVLPWESTLIVLPLPVYGSTFNLSVAADTNSTTAVLSGNCSLAWVPTTPRARSTATASVTVSRTTPVGHTPAGRSTATRAAVASTAAAAKSSGGLRTGWISFIASGSGLLLVLVLALLLWCRIRRKRRTRTEGAQLESDTDSWRHAGEGDLLFDDEEPSSFIRENHYATDPTSPVAL